MNKRQATTTADYHLLPHNIFNYDALPRREALRAGDYLLIIDQLPALSFDAAAGVLRWGTDQSVAVRKVYASPVGQLYQFTGAGQG